MIVYACGALPEPAWFTPELWEHPEAYAFYKTDDKVNTQTIGYRGGDHKDYQVLLYNAKEGKAYFIVSRVKL